MIFDREINGEIEPPIWDRITAPRLPDEKEQQYKGRLLKEIIARRSLRNWLHARPDFLVQPKEDRQVVCAQMDALPHWREVLARFRQAMTNGEFVTIYGDFDCDGVCSVTLMREFLMALGIPAAKVGCFIPLRHQHGYGVSIEGLRACLESYPETALLVTVDCGSNSTAILTQLRDGSFHRHPIDYLVFDHHQIEKSLTPHALERHLNPQLITQDSGMRYVCAAGLVFLFGLAAQNAFGIPQWDARRAGILAGLATVADVARLVDVNRLLVQSAVKLLNDQGRELTPGLCALQLLATSSKLTPASVNEETLGFVFAPCINSTGRLGSAAPSLELLAADTAEKAESLAKQVFTTNLRRIYTQSKVLRQAVEQAEAQVCNNPPSPVIFAAGLDWNVGVVGIVAGRLREKYNLPVIVCGSTDGMHWRGSGRSVEGFDLGACLLKAKQLGLLQSGGGHAMAGGLKLAESQRIPFQQWIKKQHSAPHKPGPKRIEIVASAEELTPKAWRYLHFGIGPFGAGNPYTPIILQNATLVQVRVIRGNNGPFEAVAWGADTENVLGVIFGEKSLKEFWSARAVFQVAGTRGNQRVHFIYYVYWRNRERVMKEWMLRRRYHLELISKHRPNAPDNPIFVVKECWPAETMDEFIKRTAT